MKIVDMTRGKPSSEQLALSRPMESLGSEIEPVVDGVDVRNYGVLDGLPQARALLGEIVDVSADNMIAWGNSSLTLMFLYARFLLDRFKADRPMAKPRWLALTPGYDRHFAICEALGIPMISVPMLNDGPDMDVIEELVERDSSIIGIWCVPKYSNPCGTTYSDDCVRRLAALPLRAGRHFTVFWDNAYGVHDFSTTDAPQLLSIRHEAEQRGTSDHVAFFCSTSKITFAGAGIAGIGLSTRRREEFLGHLGVLSICPDKVAQLRHVRFFTGDNSLVQHMRKHAAILRPKFDLVASTFQEYLRRLPDVSWSVPKGGYFMSLYLPHGMASIVREAAAAKGVVLTPAGAAFPYQRDPNDSHLRIAPSYPSMNDLSYATQVLAHTILQVVGQQGRSAA